MGTLTAVPQEGLSGCQLSFDSRLLGPHRLQGTGQFISSVPFRLQLLVPATHRDT